MTAEFVGKYLFLLAVAAVIFTRSMTHPVKTVLFQTPIWQSMRYGQISPIKLRPLYVATVLFIGFITSLFGIWIMARTSPELLRGLYAFSVGIVLWQLALSTKILERYNKYKVVVILVTGLLIGGLCLSWVFVQAWLVYDILAMLVAYTILSQIGPIRLRFVCAILIALALYDLWGVWGSSVVTGQTGMIVEIATKMSFAPPSVIVIPTEIFSPFSAKSSGILGIADLVIPGIVVLSASHFRLEKEVMVGFALSLLATLFVAMLSKRAIPATIVLNPMMMLSILAAARLRSVQLEW